MRILELFQGRGFKGAGREVGRLIGDAETLKSRLWARLQQCSAPVAAAPPSQNRNGSNDLLTASRAAEHLDVTPARPYELARTGTLPAIRIGRQIRFSPETLEEWIDGGGQALVGGWRRDLKS
jgi:excisionase family DNA binding protein